LFPRFACVHSTSRGGPKAPNDDERAGDARRDGQDFSGILDSLRKSETKPRSGIRFFNGADDDGSGEPLSVLEIAEAFFAGGKTSEACSPLRWQRRQRRRDLLGLRILPRSFPRCRATPSLRSSTWDRSAAGWARMIKRRRNPATCKSSLAQRRLFHPNWGHVVDAVARRGPTGRSSSILQLLGDANVIRSSTTAAADHYE